MTDTIDDTEEAGFASDFTQSHTLGESVRAYVARVRGGDMGALPSVLGLVVLFIVFGFANDRFLSNLNMANLITQSGSIIILAMALVPVLLLGDIDLSAGVAGGVSACVMGVLLVEHDQPWYLTVLAALLTGAAIGLIIGLLVAKLGIPSFVVTLGVLPRPAGRDPQADRRGRIRPGQPGRHQRHRQRQHERGVGLDLRRRDHRRLRRAEAAAATAARSRSACSTSRSRSSSPRSSPSAPC